MYVVELDAALCLDSMLYARNRHGQLMRGTARASGLCAPRSSPLGAGILARPMCVRVHSVTLTQGMQHPCACVALGLSCSTWHAHCKHRAYRIRR